MQLSSATLVRLLALGLLACDAGAHTPIITSPATATPVIAAPAPPRAALPSAAAPTPATPDAGAPDRRSDGRPGCRLERPALWTDGQVSWLGSCQGGFANGSGVIVNLAQGGEPERFYGRLEDGFLSLGVMKSSGGYLAGTWSRGTLVEKLADDVAQRNVVLDAFRTAAAAATAASKSAAKDGDARSSRSYIKQARLLRDQMD